MKQPKVEKVNLPYASNVASYFGDQGAASGNSFLGRLFAGSGRQTSFQTQAAASVSTGTSLANKSVNFGSTR